MNYWARGFCFLCVGIISFALGATSTSPGWHLLAKWPKERRWLLRCSHKWFKRLLSRATWPFVIGGVILVALGGTYTTRACNEFDHHEQKKTLLKAIAHEWKVNDSRLQELRVGSQNPRITGGSMVFPRLKSSALNAALTSHILNLSDSTDGNLFSSISAYEEEIETFNIELNEIDYTETQLSEFRRIRHQVVTGPNNTTVLFSQHSRVGSILRDDYSWIIDKQIFSGSLVKNSTE